LILFDTNFLLDEVTVVCWDGFFMPDSQENGSRNVRCLTASLPGACTVYLEKSARVLPVSPCGTIAVLQVSTQMNVR
jgi:hypothetical protein